MRSRLLLAGWLFGAACATAPATVPNGELARPVRPRVPEGCLENQAGEYVHEASSAFRYAATDDGGTLSLTVLRQVEALEPPTDDPLDGGAAVSENGAPVSEGGAAVSEGGALRGVATADGGTFIVLHRTSGGFTGVTQTWGFTTAGQTCPVEFATDVLSCADGGLTLRAEASASIDEACNPVHRGAPSPKVDHRLIRQTGP